MTYFQGKIIRQHQIFCGLCLKEEIASFSQTTYLAENQFRKMKWKKTKTHGWICPNHKKEGVKWV